MIVEVVKVIGIGFYKGEKVIIIFWFVSVNIGIVFCCVDFDLVVDFEIIFEVVGDM